MSSRILKNMKKIISVCFGDIRRRIGFGTVRDAQRCSAGGRGSSPVRNCPDEQTDLSLSGDNIKFSGGPQPRPMK